jgi:hypothetical protein
VTGVKPGEKHCFSVASVDVTGKMSLRSMPVCEARKPATMRPAVAATR